ncbi:uncharacterized protein [Littorina saxatilis]|uniref:CXXC-type domain-containing protein n=2 Tax=Littorina saxatilis TaxID=31220 RepID=A0AAN9G803_9CAEN
MAQFNMPLHVQTPAEEEYIMESHYHDNGMTSPHEMGTWMDDQGDGGGKFRLKRRRRCGQCGPCQVKENCGKCQYCLRKDILKQACIYRKCVYLRKPVPRFRPEAAGSSSSNSSVGGGGMVGGGSGATSAGSSSSNSTNKGSPQKPSTTPSTVPNHHNSQPTPSPSLHPSSSSSVAAAAQSAEQSCQLSQNHFGLPINNGVMDPLRASALDQHRSALFDASCMLDPARSAYLSSARGLESGRSPALDLGRNTNTADSGFGTNSSMTTSPASSVTKDRPLPPREQFRSPMEQWGAMPYAFPRANPWAHHALQANTAAAYGFQSGANPYANAFGSSCRLGMPDPASHLAAPAQPSFHHNMPFARPDFSAHANFRAAAPPMQPTMTPPFYPPPPHIPSSLPNFPSFSQLPSSAGHHSTYPMAHPPMYPANFYSSFRPPNESHIYHAQVSTPESPFSRSDSGFPPFLGIESSFDKDNKNRDSEEDEDDLKKKFSIFRIPCFKHTNCDLSCEDDASLDFSKAAAEYLHRQKDMVDLTWLRDKDPGNMLLKTTPAIDDDLQQHMKRISGRGECDVISIDDFKMHAFIRSDGFNNLEIEIDSPSMEAAFSKTLNPVEDASCRLENQQLNNSTICEKGGGDNDIDSRDYTESALLTGKTLGATHRQGEKIGCVETLLESSRRSTSHTCSSDCAQVSPNQILNGDCVRVLGETTAETLADQRQEESRSQENCHGSRTLSEDMVVCLVQEGEEGTLTELEVPGVHVQLQEVSLDHHIISTSSDPRDLLRFISQHAPPPASSSPDLVFHFGRESPDDLELDPEDFS